MFNFAYPNILLLLLLVPVFVALFAWVRYNRRIKLRKFGNKIPPALMSDVSAYKPILKLIMQMMALICIIIAFARPWGGVKDEKTTKEGIEVVIAVDASNSMLAPIDGESGVNRMKTAKMMLERLISRLSNDRVGLIVYTADAYTLIPVTNDYVSAKIFLNSIDPSQFNNQGTNISQAISLGLESFQSDKRIGKAMILLTDAEELEDENAVMNIAKRAAQEGVQLDVIGVGSTTAAKIPYNGGFLIDTSTGQPVETALNEELASKIAVAGKGIYVNASNGEALNELSKQLSTLKKSTLQSSLSAVHDELFWIFVVGAICFIIADILLLERKIGWLDKITFFKKETL